MAGPLNIAIVAHFAYGAMAGGRHGHVGGVERQTSFMSRWLAARGHQVSLLTWDEGQGDEVMIDGVRVIAICRQDAGMPGVRFFVPRWSGLNRALYKADAALCYHNCAEYVTGQVASWCARRKRGFVFSVASDVDVDPALPELRKLRERTLYRYGLRHADRIIVQTQSQQESLRKNFGLVSQPLPMPCPGPDETRDLTPGLSSTNGRPIVLWAGRIAAVKRLELLLQVAALLPQLQFQVAGMPYVGDPYSEGVLSDASRLANVELLGTVPREQMAERYQNAAVLCCTSAYEGFPNTFVEAWSYGVPVVSTVDPDKLLSVRGLGAHAATVPELAAAIFTMVSQPEELRKISQRARQYYLANHAVDVAMERFENLFRSVSEERQARTA